MYSDSLNKVINIIKTNAKELNGSFPSTVSKNYSYKKKNTFQGSNGFGTGELILAKLLTKGHEFDVAIEKTISGYKNVDLKELDNHNSGVVIGLSTMLYSKLFSAPEGMNVLNKNAKNIFLSRFVENPGFFESYGEPGKEGRITVDTVLTILMPLQFGDYTDEEFSKIYSHYRICIDNLIREDYGTNTALFYNSDGILIKNSMEQNWGEDTSGARGHAKIIYSIAHMQSFKRSEDDIKKGIKLANYFIDHLPSDKVSYGDVALKEGSNMPKDTSAMVIFVCGVLEMLKNLDSENKKIFCNHLNKIIPGILKYINDEPKGIAPLLLEGTYTYTDENRKVANEGMIWGDYFLMEMFMKLKNKEFSVGKGK